MITPNSNLQDKTSCNSKPAAILGSLPPVPRMRWLGEAQRDLRQVRTPTRLEEDTIDSGQAVKKYNRQKTSTSQTIIATRERHHEVFHVAPVWNHNRLAGAPMQDWHQAETNHVGWRWANGFGKPNSFVNQSWSSDVSRATCDTATLLKTRALLPGSTITHNTQRLLGHTVASIKTIPNLAVNTNIKLTANGTWDCANARPQFYLI